jgi:hypothetical protein
MPLGAPVSIVVRTLTGSDLGWFDEPRRRGQVTSRQRAINFNKDVVRELFPEELRAGGRITFQARGRHPGDGAPDQERELILSEKNWRLCGPKVEGIAFGDIRAGDFFVAAIQPQGNGQYSMYWTVVMQGEQPELHRELVTLIRPELVDSMASGPAMKRPYDRFGALVDGPVPGESVKDSLSPATASATGSSPVPARPVGGQLPRIPGTDSRPVRKPTLADRLRHPHILSEMMKVATQLSAQAQMDFLDVLRVLAEQLRARLHEAGMIGRVDIDHGAFWPKVRGNRIAFVDGGVANLEALGSAPIAIRVGSYTVTPGERSDTREQFAFDRTLIGELYAPSDGGGFYEDMFEDPAPLRDAARFCLELSGALEVATGDLRPAWLLLHGPLVNPVSMYAVKGFPNFSKGGLSLLLPPEDRNRNDRDANFVRVYRRQIELLRACGTKVCGVVERASGSRIVIGQVLKQLLSGEFITSDFLQEATRRTGTFHISDAILFQAVLEPGEYLRPVEVDRNDLGRAPAEWVEDIRIYPRPLVGYVNASDSALPLRVEAYDTLPDPDRHGLFELVVHSARLLPRYVFPAGLDIVDKHAKLPDWMARPINSRLATQLMRKAVERARETDNPRIVAAMRRMLSGNTRDWLFRPKP